jgi:hypothetical protein
MIKPFLTRCVPGEVLPAALFFCLLTLTALAQNSSSANEAGAAKAIGPAAPNTPQSHLLYDVALSSKTRQTLQEAMNSTARTSDASHPAAPAK